MASTVSMYFMSSVNVEPLVVARELTSTPTRTSSSSLTSRNLPLPTTVSGLSGTVTCARFGHSLLVAPRSTLHAASRPARDGVNASPVTCPRLSAKVTFSLNRFTTCMQSGAAVL